MGANFKIFTFCHIWDYILDSETGALVGNWVIQWNMADSGALLKSLLLSSKSRVPGKRCIVKYCDKTNADHFSLFQFPDKVKHRSVFDQSVKFVEVIRDPCSWSRAMCMLVLTISHLRHIMRILHNYNMVIKQYPNWIKIKKRQCHPRYQFQHQGNWWKTARNFQLLKA